MIKIENVSLSYKKKIIVSDINFSANKGEIVALVGVNGAGKTTLLKSISKSLPIKRGEIKINKVDLKDFKTTDFAKMVSFVASENVRINNMSVTEFIAFGRFPYTGFSGFLCENDKKVIDSAILSTGIAQLAHKKITNISSGEFQKVLIARSVAQATPIILLDEPASFLDIDSKYATFDLLKKMAHQQHKTIVFSSHDISASLKIADKIWLLKKENPKQAAPEDLMLSNAFSDFFTTENLKFDNQKADFVSIVKPKKSIFIIYDENCYLAKAPTKHCLLRNGFFVSEKSCSLTLKIGKKNGKFVWIISENKKNKVFNNLYLLSKQLKIILNRI